MNQGGTSIGKEWGKGTKVASQVYMGQHICSTEPCLLNPISHCRNRVLRCQGRWGWSRREAGMAVGRRSLLGWVPAPMGDRSRTGGTGGGCCVCHVCERCLGPCGCCTGTAFCLVELLAARCHQEHTLSLGTSPTWEHATATACTENTPLDPATSSSWQADF